ncbi:MAG: hydrolase [Muribaculaceae bacterium]|nr:hydrolase [Muribaculaceae bacterium]
MRRLLLLAGIAAISASTAAIKTSDMISHDASQLPLLGTLAPDAEKAYSRLPDSLHGTIRDELWNLGLNSAGLAIRFSSDASAIGARWTALNRFNMNHMTPTGIHGLDLYVLQEDSTWTTVASGRPSLSSKTTSAMIMEDMEPKMREYMLYLPLYDGVDSIYILTDSAARVLPPEINLPKREKPMVMYGTSILQGGCANRPGMAHTSILERMFNREVVNLGFSGNARLDPEIARVMASADASVFVIDPLPNCTAQLLDEKLAAFVAILREKHPAVPILLVESPMFPAHRFNREVDSTLREKNRVCRKIYDELRKSDANLHYMSSDELGIGVESSVDNYHLTDLGFSQFAEAMQRKLETILQ